MARVNQHEGACQSGPSPEIAAQHGLPFLHFLLRRLGIAVARHVDEGEGIGDVEEIELAGAARRVGGPGQFPDPGQGIDKGRLADIGTAGKGDFNARGRRQLVKCRHSQHEGGGGRKQPAARQELVAGEARGQVVAAGFFFRKGRLSRMLPRRSISTPWRFMM